MSTRKYETLGLMVDVSRNNVMSLDGWRRFLPIAKKMGYNAIFLYAEDTYEVEGEPYFGYMRGRYTIDEMKELDELSAGYGIEMIPCVQALAHLDAIAKWGKYPMDTQGTLLVGDERTYELIENMFKTLSKCFRTRRIHVGMDEAMNLGRGKYHDKNGCETQAEIMRKHLARVTEIAKKYNFELMIWSDMFFRGWNGSYYAPKTKIPEDYVAAVPEGVIPVYWDYYSQDESRYDDMISNHKQLTKNIWFAGGAWTWRGFTPDNAFTLKTMLPALEACKKNKVKNIFFTMWGDNGGECSKLGVLPSLFYLSEVMKGNSDEEKIKAKFKRAFGISYDDFMLIDEPCAVYPMANPDKQSSAVSKSMLYSDYFNGFLDATVVKGGNQHFAALAEKLEAVAKSSRKLGYLFDTQAKLCRVLSVKYELGVKTRAAYKAGDKAELSRLAREEYTELSKLLRAFYKSFKKQWMHENKACGFEVQEARLGAMMLRTESCKERLLDFASGAISEIPELDEEILLFNSTEFGNTIYYNSFTKSYTSNVM